MSEGQARRLYLMLPSSPMRSAIVTNPTQPVPGYGLKLVSEGGVVEITFVDGTQRPPSMFIALADFERLAAAVVAWGNP